MTGLYVASNSTALGAQFNLTRNMSALSDTLTRLSTGLRINSGKDDPAGLIASELLKSEITGTNKAITNTERANSMIATADSALGQVGSLLNDIKGLVVEAANTGAMSSDQIAANQLQIDASIDAIDRISRTTTYAGQKLLDGSLDFTTDSCGGNTGISNLQINSANFGTADSVGVNVKVQEAARRGTLEYYGTGVDQTTTMDITGSVGTKSFTFGAGTTNAEMATAINGASDSTGVQARVEGEAARGSVILSSAGSNNDIVVTANDVGLDAGNYTFRITQGAENDARIVSEAAGGTPGVVEISLKESYESNYGSFAGLFNIAIDGQYAVDAGLTQADVGGTGTDALTAAQAETSISITRGDANTVSFYSKDSAAVASTSNGKSLTAAYDTAATTGSPFHMSQLNGWTVVIDDSVTAAAGQVFQDNKTVRINSADVADTTDMSSLTTLLSTALGVEDGEFELNMAGNAFVNGDTLTFKGGGDAGELAITYKEGATASDILKMVNNAPYVSASLASGVDGSTLVPALPDNKTYVSTTQADPGTEITDLSTASRYASSATSQDVIDLINSKLGDKFTATALSGDGTGGRVSYMDAAVDYGSVNLDNALRFTGMDNGPVIRLTTTGADGMSVANQTLGVNIIQPSEADIKAGIHTPILEVRLATDASGNSITTAADIAKLFDSLTAEETLGVSAEVLYPDGVDPNGRVWYDDGCGNILTYEGCPEPFGTGIVQPTGVPGECEVAQNDLVLLGANQSITDDYAVARIKSGTAIEGSPAVATGDAIGADGVTVIATGGETELTFGNTSALNGMTFAFTTAENMEGFDETTGKLTMFIDPVTAAMDATTAAADEALAAIVNGAIAANWEGIRAYTGATGDAVKLDTANQATGELANAILDAASGLTIGIDASTSTAASTATRGVATDDPALTITAKNAGTDMAGVKIYFVNDNNATDLAVYDLDAWDGTDTIGLDAIGVPDIKVDYMTYEDGSRALIVTANIIDGGTDNFGSMVGGTMLAEALNANSTFSTYFTAEADLIAAGTASIGGVEFLKDTTQAAAQTVGGYRVDSPGVSGSNYTGTSSGIGMTGQSDDNQKLILEATEVGSDNFVKVYVAEGSFDTYCPMGIKMCELAGTDVVATINGNKASASGNDISINNSDLSMSMTVDGNVGETSFNITGGGALFQLGSNVVSTNQMRLGIGSVSSTHLGGSSGKLFQLKSGGSADLSSDEKMKLADRIVNESISSVATTRGRLGAIQKSSLEPNINALQDTLVALTEAEAGISNADFAEESSNLTQLQLLVQAGSSVLGIANQLPQYAASLVR